MNQDAMLETTRGQKTQLGTNYLAVNETKKQFLDPSGFGDNPKSGGHCRGLHATALCMLVCKNPGTSNEIRGSWSGDLVCYVGDQSDTQKYEEVCRTYKDVTHKAFLMLLEHSDDIRDNLFEAAKEDNWTLYHLGQIGQRLPNEHVTIRVWFEDHNFTEWEMRYETVRRQIEGR